jgi:hypothetical protein
MGTAKTVGRSPSNGRPRSKRKKIEIKYSTSKTRPPARSPSPKRKPVILKKAKVAAIIFSEGGKPFALGSPSVDSVLLRCIAPLPGEPYLENDETDRVAVEATLRQATKETTALVEAASEADQIRVVLPMRASASTGNPAISMTLSCNINPAIATGRSPKLQAID